MRGCAVRHTPLVRPYRAGTYRCHADGAESPWTAFNNEGPGRKTGALHDCVLFLCYGVTFPKSMNIVPAPSVSVNEYPNPAGQLAPPCEPGGKV